MRTLFIDKTAVLGSNHERYEKIASHSGVELCVLSPVCWHEHMRDVHVERTSHPDYQIRLGKTFWTGSYSRGYYWSGLGKVLKEFQPEVIQLLEEPWSLFAGQTVWNAKRLTPQARVFFYTWENIYRKGTYCSKLDPIHALVERRVFNESAGGVCATGTAHTVLLKRGYQQSTRVIPYGISNHFFLQEEDLSRRLSSPLSDPPRMGYIGRLLPMKGVDTLISALPHVPGHLVVLGSGPDEPRLRQHALNLGVQGRIEWVSAVTPDEVANHMARLDVLVLPSITTPVWAEQLGRVLIEAMASGVPVLGSSSGSIPEVIGDAGWIFNEGEPRDLARALLEVFSNHDGRTTRIRRGWERVRSRYTWDRFAKDLLAFYRDSLTSSR
jgi:glycosyltransferase involved in cell wall biosynthesis